MNRLIAIAAALICVLSGIAGNGLKELENELRRFVSDKDATIGIAVIVDGKDTLTVNGTREFPMLSFYKLPIALAYANHCRRNSMTLDTEVSIGKEDLHPDTYSPMTERILADATLATSGLTRPAKELLDYMLRLSDNNASDIILREAGGPESVARFLLSNGITDINVKHTEDAMHRDNSLCYQNSATPLAAAKLMWKLHTDPADSLTAEIKRILETCATGTNRLAAPLAPAGATIGHKTGTGFTLPDGRQMAVNDAGYILPSSDTTTPPPYAIAVFIKDSAYTLPQTETLIATISAITLRHLTH